MKLVIPDRIWYGPWEYLVKSISLGDPEWGQFQNCAGMVDHKRQVILLDSDLTEVGRVETLLHECLHIVHSLNCRGAALNELLGEGGSIDGDKVEEAFVEAHSTGLMLLFHSNPELCKLIGKLPRMRRKEED